MIKVGLITSFGDRCGISEYAAHIVQYVKDPEVEITVLPTSVAEYVKGPKQFDIIHVNECGWTMGGFHQDQVFAMKARGEKTLLTCHASHPVNSTNALTLLFDHVITHEINDQSGYHFIPQGAPVYEIKQEIQVQNYIGTQGFPLPHKNLPALAEACQNANFSLIAMIANSHHADANEMAYIIKQKNPTAIVDTSWKTDESIIDTLRACTASCFPYRNATPGPSAAANYGVAARRPLIVSRCNQFAHLKKHEEEVYWIESMAPTVQEITNVLIQVRKDTRYTCLGGVPWDLRVPYRLYDDMRWDKAGQDYVKLYKEIAA